MLHLSVQWFLHNGSAAFLSLTCMFGICDNSTIIHFYVCTNICRLLGKTVGQIPQKTSEETWNGVGKQRAWGDQKRRNKRISNNKKQKWNHLNCRHVKKEAPAAEPYGESSHPLSAESAHLIASLKHLYTNTYNTEIKQEELSKSV